MKITEKAARYKLTHKLQLCLTEFLAVVRVQFSCSLLSEVANVILNSLYWPSCDVTQDILLGDVIKVPVVRKSQVSQNFCTL